MNQQRLQEEVELHREMDRRLARERQDAAWARGLLVLLIEAVAYYWLFVRPERLALLTPTQIRNRRCIYLVVVVAVVIGLAFVGQG